MEHFTLMRMFGTTLFLTCASLSVFAQKEAEVKVFTSEYQSRVLGVSDNGQYAVGAGNDGGQATYPFIWNITENVVKYLPLSVGSDEICMYADAKDVTNDGKIIAGEYDKLPALYYVETAEWKTLPLPSDEYVTGWAQKITPDGTYVIGIALDESGYNGVPCVWKNGELVEISLPEKNMFGEIVTLARFDDISADGSILVGRQSYNSFPHSSSGFVYKLDTREFHYIAEDVMLYETPQGIMLDNHLEDMTLSPNGKKTAGIFYESTYTGESEDFDYAALSEYYTSFEYDIDADDFKSYGKEFENVATFAIDNNGVLYGASPLFFPVRTAYIIKDGTKITLESYLAENYGIEDFLGSNGFNSSGTITGVSADGSVLIGMADMSGNNYAVVCGDISGIQGLEQQPLMDVVTVDGSLLLKGDVVSVKVMDMLGRVLVEVNNPGQSLQFDHMKGIYLIQLRDASGKTLVKKVILQ